MNIDSKTIQQLIGQYTKPQLQELVGYMAGRSENAQQALLDFCQKMEKSTKTDNHALIIEKQIARHWTKAKETIAEFDCYGGGSEWDEENAYDELDRMTQLIESNEVSWTVRSKVLDEMLAFVASDKPRKSRCYYEMPYLPWLEGSMVRGLRILLSSNHMTGITHTFP